MTTGTVAPDPATDDGRTGPDPRPPDGGGTTDRSRLPVWARTSLAMVAAFAAFAALLVVNGTDPIAGYRAMFDSITRDSTSFGDVLVRLTPYLLAALAVAIPARAGLFNIGGEGQLLIGAVGAMGMAEALGQAVPSAVTLAAMAAAAMVAAGVWAGIAVALRIVSGTNEAISTLICNYLAFLVLGWLTFGPWKDPAATGFPRTRILDEVETLPTLWGRVHVGIVVAGLLAVAVWAILRFTPFGHQLSVLGGNPEAARRAGYRTRVLAASALMLGGAVAGLGGMLQFAGVEGQLRPQMMAGYGFTGVLAAWMVKHHPVRIIASAGLLAAIAVGGNGLKIRAGLSAASVNILMALLLLAVLGWGSTRLSEARR